MPRPSLRHAVSHHCDSPIEVWNGNNFQPSSIKLNFSSRNQNREPTPYHFLQGDYSDPLSTTLTNVIREVSTNQVWVIISSKINTHRSEPYGTIYRGVLAHYFARLWEMGEPAASVSGKRYATDLQRVDTEVASTHVNISRARTGTVPRPFTAQAMSGTATCYIDSHIAVRRGMELRLDIGTIYTIQDFILQDPQAYFCTLALVGDS